LCSGTIKGDIPERVRDKIASYIGHWREVVDALKKSRHVDGENAGHNLRDGKKHGRNVDSETSVGEEGIELNFLLVKLPDIEFVGKAAGVP